MCLCAELFLNFQAKPTEYISLIPYIFTVEVISKPGIQVFFVKIRGIRGQNSRTPELQNSSTLAL
jgi:hypothetical protein